MTNLGGNDLESILDAFHGAASDKPACFIAYTIKGYRLPFQGHTDNHAGLMTPEQIAVYRSRLGIPEGEEWGRFAGLDVNPADLSALIADAPSRTERRHTSAAMPVPGSFEKPGGERMSTTQARALPPRIANAAAAAFRTSE